MIKPIVLYGADVLRRKAKIVPPKHKELTTLVQNMYETMYAASGVGLAAPQIGLSLQLFVVGGRYTGEEAIKDIEEVFINPKISLIGDKKEEGEEGCLSIPGVSGKVKRACSLRIQYETLARTTKERKVDGLLARIIQHEYDHLQGILFVDHISSLQRRMIKRRLGAVAKAQDIPYLTVVQA